MLRLAASWVWDFWFADDGDRYHLFFLKASRALADPERRHHRASIGHAVSDDLVTWTELPDALVPADEPAFDDLATWTGSIVRDDDGVWRLFYTGVSRVTRGIVQRIGSARSRDLLTWTRDDIVLAPDAHLYETLPVARWREEAWRDPFVFRDPDAGGWRMLITARALYGDPRERGVVGTATSPDLDHWTVQPALSRPDNGFGHLEVLRGAVIDGQPILLFACQTGDMGGRRAGRPGGIWAVSAPSLSGPFAIEDAYRVTDESLYVGGLVQRRDGRWAILAFRNTDADGAFVGEVTDPLDVVVEGGRLRLADHDHPAVPQREETLA